MELAAAFQAQGHDSASAPNRVFFFFHMGRIVIANMYDIYIYIYTYIYIYVYR